MFYYNIIFTVFINLLSCEFDNLKINIMMKTTAKSERAVQTCLLAGVVKVDMNLYGKDNRPSEHKCPVCGKPLTKLNSLVYTKVILKCYNSDCPTTYPNVEEWRKQSQNGRVWFCPKCGEPKMHYDFNNHLFVCWNDCFMLPEKDGVSLQILVELGDD